MTKKHFIAFADEIRNQNKYGPTPFTSNQLEALAHFCASQNPNFNRARWLSYIAGQCGPNGGAR
jgi:hypothetical protein